MGGGKAGQSLPALSSWGAKEPWNETSVMYAPSLRRHRKISEREYVTNGPWEGDTGAALFSCLPAQERQLCNLSSLSASPHRGILFHFTFMVFGRELGFNKWTKFAHFEVGARVQNSEGLWGQVDWFNGASLQLIYPKCLRLCDVCHELTSSGFVRFFFTYLERREIITQFIFSANQDGGSEHSFLSLCAERKPKANGVICARGAGDAGAAKS